MHCYIFGLGYCAFARHYLRNHFCFLLLRVLRCFSSPRLPSTFVEEHSFTMLGCSIRKSRDHRLFAPPPSLSQLITSFIASQSLGIHRSLLFAFFILLFARTWVRYVAISYFKYSIPFLLIINYSLLIRVRYCFTTFSLFLSIYQRSSLFTIYSFTIYNFISQWKLYFWINRQ